MGKKITSCSSASGEGAVDGECSCGEGMMQQILMVIHMVNLVFAIISSSFSEQSNNRGRTGLSIKFVLENDIDISYCREQQQAEP